ncbi:MAG: hypothetical protein ACREQR_15795 [Candidatus Binataceae bacterium]
MDHDSIMRATALFWEMFFYEISEKKLVKTERESHAPEAIAGIAPARAFIAENYAVA